MRTCYATAKVVDHTSWILVRYVDGLHCPEKYLYSCFETSNMSQNLFVSLLSLSSAMETATNIYVRQTPALRYSLPLCRNQGHKGEMTLSQCGANQIYTPVP